MMQCPKCRLGNPERAKFCGGCGVQLADVAPEITKSGEAASNRATSSKPVRRAALATRARVAVIAAVAVVAAGAFWWMLQPPDENKRDDSGLYRINVDGKHGFMDRSGKTVITPQFDGAQPFSEGLAPVQVGSRFGFINTKGEMVITPQFDAVFPFSEGLAAVQVGTKFGYIDKKGLMAITPQFDDVNPFHNGRAAVKLEGGRHWDGSDRKIGHAGKNRYGFIDREGKYVGMPGLLFVQSDFLNESGWTGDATLVRTADDRIGIMNSRGEVSPALEVDEVGWSGFADGIAPAAIGGKWGYVDAKGEWVINPQFESAHGYEDGLAAVASGQRWGLIDREGKFVVNPQYDSIFGMAEGYAIVERDRGSIQGCEHCGRYGFIDMKGRAVANATFEQRPDINGGLSAPVAAFSEGLAAIKTDQGWGFIDQAGRRVIEPQFDRVGSFRGGLAFVSVLGKEAYIAKNGAFVVDPFPGTTVKAMKEKLAAEAAMPFLGKWTSDRGADLIEISHKGSSFDVLYKEEYGPSPTPVIACKLMDGSLVGDYYGHLKNFRVSLSGDDAISLSIDPFAEFAPVRDQRFSKSVTLRFIVIAYEGGRQPARAGQQALSLDEAVRRAASVAARLRAGADFAQTAETESDDERTRISGGSLGTVSLSRLDMEIRASARTLKPGQVSDPVTTHDGVFIIRVE